MKLYKITAVGNAASPDGEAHWVGTQADASSKRKQLVSDGYKRTDIVTQEVDVPTDKQGLIAFLNSNKV